MSDFKESVKVAVKANVVLPRHTSVGAFNLDGVQLVSNDRILLIGQTNPAQNGIYTLKLDPKDPNSAYLGRTADGKKNELTSGMVVSVEKGTYADTILTLVTDGQIIVDTTPLIFKPLDINKIIAWIKSNDVQVKFVESSYSANAGSPVVVTIKIADGDGTVDTFNSSATVVVSADNGGVINEAMPIRFNDGLAEITVNKSIPGTVVLSLSGGNTTLNLSSISTVTFV